MSNIPDQFARPTTDPAPDKPTQRAPMLSDDEFTDVIGHAGSQSGLLVRDWYEAKITSGELIFNPDYKP